MSDAAFERGFVAGWEARGRRDEAMAVEEELRMRGQVEEAKTRGAVSAMRVCAFCGEPTDAHGDCQSVGCVGWRTPERASQWAEEMRQRAAQQQGRQLTEAEWAQAKGWRDRAAAQGRVVPAAEWGQIGWPR